MQSRIRTRAALALSLVVLMPEGDPVVRNNAVATDEEQILEHIHGLFRAYLAGDRATIRRGHTRDWVGFPVAAEELVRGIDEYMQFADAALERLRGRDYELLETEVEVHGDLAVVYYLARYTVEDGNGGLRDLRLRSVDLYRREAEGWNQAGSNICLVPSLAAAAAATPRTLQPAEERALLEARDAVWRAWFAGDLEALAELVPPEALVLDPGAAAWSDHDALRRASAEFHAGGGKLLALEFPATEFLVYGPVATLFTRYRLELLSGGERQVMEGRGTELFVWRDGRWWNPSWHLAPEPAGAH